MSLLRCGRQQTPVPWCSGKADLDQVKGSGVGVCFELMHEPGHPSTGDRFIQVTQCCCLGLHDCTTARTRRPWVLGVWCRSAHLCACGPPATSATSA